MSWRDILKSTVDQIVDAAVDAATSHTDITGWLEGLIDSLAAGETAAADRLFSKLDKVLPQARIGELLLAAGVLRDDESELEACLRFILDRGLFTNRDLIDATFAVVERESDRVSTVIRYLLTSYQPDFAVMRGPRLLGVVRRSQVLAALAQREGDAPVSALMTDAVSISVDQSLAETRQLLAESPSSVAAVFADSRFVGLVSAEDIAEAQAVLSFVRPATPPRPESSALHRAELPART